MFSLALLALTYLQRDIGKLIEIGRIVNGSHLDGYGRWTLANVFPVDTSKERHRLEVLEAALRAQAPIGFATKVDDRLFGLLRYGYFWWKY